MEQKKYYIPVNGELIEVSEEIYREYNRAIANERAHARREHKCGQPDYRKCRGDCGLCPWVQEGTNMLSFSKAFGKEAMDGDDNPLYYIPDLSSQLIDDIVAEREEMRALTQKLDALVPDGGSIVKMLMDGHSEREIAHALGVSRQSTINYRTRKIKAYLQAHWNDLFDC